MPRSATGLAPWLAAAAARRRDRHLERQRVPYRVIDPVRVRDDTRTLVNFSSNDYLGLATHPELVEAMRSAAQQHGAGAGAAALVTGYRPAHAELESELADFLQRERVLLFGSGYMANLAVASSLAGRGDRVVQDRLCHASLIDAARLSGARLMRYRHADPASLERQLAADTPGRTLVVTDGVFSMDGDLAPLDEIAGLSAQNGAWLVVDDAHGIGVAGPGGRGTVAAAGLGEDRVPVLVGTLGKAFGCAGAFVAGSAGLVEHLVNEARTYIFTTAMPPALAAAAHAGVRLARREKWRRARLQESIAAFRSGARARGLSLLPSESPIQPLLMREPERALHLSRALAGHGFLVQAIRPPTVPEGTSRLRITLSAAHEDEHVQGLLEALDRCLDSR